MNKVLIGKKIKERRLTLGLTQSEVVTDFMTRNMLSLIESGNAMPSIESAEYLAKKLDLPLPFLFSQDESLFLYEKKEKISAIQEQYKKQNYEYCMKIIDSLSDTDYELNYIYAFSAFNFGKEALFSGSLFSADKYLTLALKKAEETIYNTFEIEATAPMYLSVVSNIQSPLLEFDSDKYEDVHMRAFDYEFFKYITLDFNYQFKNSVFKEHLEAKALIKRYSYIDAIAILKNIEESKNIEYNACVLFGVYTDLETSYKQIGDFENAYRYSSKRITLLNAFKS